MKRLSLQRFLTYCAVPLIFVIAKISSSDKIMGEHKSGKLSKTLVWLDFCRDVVSALAIVVTLFIH